MSGLIKWLVSLYRRLNSSSGCPFSLATLYGRLSHHMLAKDSISLIFKINLCFLQLNIPTCWFMCQETQVKTLELENSGMCSVSILLLLAALWKSSSRSTICLWYKKFILEFDKIIHITGYVLTFPRIYVQILLCHACMFNKHLQHLGACKIKCWHTLKNQSLAV